MKTATLAWEMDEIALHRNAMLCDGDRLVMLAQRDVEVVQRTAGELGAGGGGWGDTRERACLCRNTTN